MLSLFPKLLNYQQFAPLFLRFALGAIFFFAGLASFYPRVSSHKYKLLVIFLSCLEIVFGLLLFVGLFVQIVALLIIFIVIINIVAKIKAKEKFLGGYDFDFLILASAFSLLVLGPGLFAIDLPL